MTLSSIQTFNSEPTVQKLSRKTTLSPHQVTTKFPHDQVTGHLWELPEVTELENYNSSEEAKEWH